MKSWYLLHTKSRFEFIARNNLTYQRYENYLPLSYSDPRSGKNNREIEPMFPRYMFLRLDDEHDDWSMIKSTKGVQSLVRFGDIPAHVPDKLIAEIKRREDDNGVHRLYREYQPGDHVRFAAGPYKYYEGIIEGLTGKDRVKLLLLAVSRISIDVKMRDIEPVK